ncbi:MAG: outer membrane protein assembly factor BamC [Gammaproteobacteria bacterium]|uniref:Outer membrane protein assembly factor BamC n=1 Tax=SAR86 cluster bacterium TaxID=2030880 RepID=A0A368C7H1_9GAMM|nr:MAG: outer membrane protein assembly factor BamC [SAR86 cluster bacterium]
MKNTFIGFLTVTFISSCSYLTGPEGLFPETKYDFLEEEVAPSLRIPEELDKIDKENHYPIAYTLNNNIAKDVPKPRQVFSSGGASEVQLRRLGELMWIYVETLPSTAWPISKNYWETSSYQIISTDAETGVIKVAIDDNSSYEMIIEHGIKEASTEIFLKQINNNNEDITDIESIKPEFQKVVDYLAASVENFSGTSLAAQSLNERKKARIFTQNDQTVIELDLTYPRAWSAVSRALTAGNIVTNDRNRDKGIFYVSYASEVEAGFFSFLSFGQDENEEGLVLGDEAEFEIKVKSLGSKTIITAEATNGSIEDAETLLSKINESLS